MAGWVQRIFATLISSFTNDDMIGVELGGHEKTWRCHYRRNHRWIEAWTQYPRCLITRGLTEIRRLGIKLGAGPGQLSATGVGT